MSLSTDLDSLIEKETNLTSAQGKMAKFCYTDQAYADDDYRGVEEYDAGDEQNIPLASATVLKVNPTVLTEGFRAQASSISRMLVDHFFGRASYNLNKIHDNFLTFVTSLKNSLGTANGVATLNSYGTVTSEQIRQVRTFTYVVNSDASLEYWLTNKASGTSSGGDDFTSVLIKKGEWTFEGETVALDTIGTLYVEGEAGSLINITKSTTCKYGLYYSEIKNDVSMFGVNAKYVVTDDFVSHRYDTENSCFYRCNNLINCIGKCESARTDNKSWCSGFNECQSLTNCYGQGIGFYKSEMMANYASSGFHKCMNLISCKGYGCGGNYSGGYGFHGCRSIQSCCGKGERNITTSGSASSYGFSACVMVSNCWGYEHSDNSVFSNDCYASSAFNNDYKCADTPAGGFNNTTNPSA